jgi:hypothetical protein
VTGTTAEGRQAYQLLDWANQDQARRVPEAIAKVDDLARPLLGDPGRSRALNEVRDVGQVLARLKHSLDGGAAQEHAAGTLAAQLVDLADWQGWRDEPRDSHGRFTHGAAAVIEKVTEPIRDEGKRGNSRPVSEAEFHQMAAEGRDRLKAIQAAPWGTSGLSAHWGAVKARAYAEVQKSWGGATVDPRTGGSLPQGADKYAMSVKPSGLDTTSISEHASAAEFGQAMDVAKAKYGAQLAKGGSYLGIFHDDDLNRIDIDPVTVLDSLREVETIGAYTHAIGGAYHFASGDGFWPPHVPSGASMSAEDGHWAGPGQWHSHAVAVQPGLTAEQERELAGDDEAPQTVTAQMTGLAGQLIGLAADATVAPAAMTEPGLPVPGDPQAVAMFTAHRLDSLAKALGHGFERLDAARVSEGDLRRYHCERLARHVKDAHDQACWMRSNLIEHYPAEGRELQDLEAKIIGMATAVYPAAGKATFAHLLQTVLYQLGHTYAHAQSLLEDHGDDGWDFDADHAENHLKGAKEHVDKLAEHIRDNYPREAALLKRLTQNEALLMAEAEDYDDPGLETDLAWMERYLDEEVPAGVADGLAALGGLPTITGQLELASAGGRHVKGTPYTYFHGWIPRAGQQLLSKYPAWRAGQHKAGAKPAARQYHSEEARVAAAVNKSIRRHQQKLAAAKPAAGQSPRIPQSGRVAPPPSEPGSVGAKLSKDDPALASLAAPGMDVAAVKAYIDARVAAEVARQMGEITNDEHRQLASSLSRMHVAQQKLISSVRKNWAANEKHEDKVLQTKLTMNSLFTIAGVAAAIGGISIGVTPVMAAIIGGAVPLVNVIHDYVRGLA